MILSLTSDMVPLVRIILSGTDLPSGVAWELRASYSEAGRTVSYRPRGGSGVGVGGQLVLVDAAAPIRTPVTYTLTRAGIVVSSAVIVRTAPSGDLITDMRGSVVATIRRTADGGFSQTLEPRIAFADVPGSRTSPARLAPIAGVGVAAFGAVTDPASTWAMRDLITANAPVFLLHDCTLPLCDVPRAELALITAVPSDRRTAGHPERAWTITYRPTADPEPDLVVALATWDEHDAPLTGKTWNQHDQIITGKTWDQYDLIDWGALG